MTLEEIAGVFRPDGGGIADVAGAAHDELTTIATIQSNIGKRAVRIQCIAKIGAVAIALIAVGQKRACACTTSAFRDFTGQSPAVAELRGAADAKAFVAGKSACAFDSALTINIPAERIRGHCGVTQGQIRAGAGIGGIPWGGAIKIFDAEGQLARVGQFVVQLQARFQIFAPGIAVIAVRIETQTGAVRGFDLCKDTPEGFVIRDRIIERGKTRIATFIISANQAGGRQTDFIQICLTFQTDCLTFASLSVCFRVGQTAIGGTAEAKARTIRLGYFQFRPGGF